MQYFHRLSDNYVDLSDLYVILSDLIVRTMTAFKIYLCHCDFSNRLQSNKIISFFTIFTLFTCKNNQLFKDSLSKFKNMFYDCIVDRKNIPIHCQCLQNSSMFSLCFTILWPFLIIHKLCVIITIQVLLCIFIKRTPFMSHYFISVSWYYIIKCRHFKYIEETMN